MAKTGTEGAPVAALLLTGGASRRMGRDKATIVFDGEPLARRTAALLARRADPVLEVGPGFTNLPHLLEDPPGSGPLAAMAAGGAALWARHHQGPVLVIGTDLPHLSDAFLRTLAEYPVPGADYSVVPRDATGRPQPVCARYSPEALVRAQELVAAGHRSVMALLERVPVSWLDTAEGEPALFDVDTPKDLESATRARIPAVTRHPATPVRVVAVRPDHHLEMPDQVATEEPMEIRVAGPGCEPRAVAVTMRTPGHDFDLAVGFLFTEGLIRGGGDVAAVRYCDLPEGAEQRFNVVTVDLTTTPPEQAWGRNFTMTASCGICGKSSIDQVSVACPVVAASPPLSPLPRSWIVSLPDQLRRQQRLFDRTGGLHGAAIADPGDTAPLTVREDVGRHNAVDKLVGQAVLAGDVPLAGRVLVVSGRVSFEIVQKAAMAGVAAIVAVSAPSSLAVDAADRLGLTLVGFVRGEKFNIYTHPERIDL
ncbi:MAG TPA: formate dehydrogenase accessory sulfurtransferase FdhD [Acidimicrobiales bacterium]|jgi:FdhD protein|nr:formate dehydrogenase accessory sulfurtransferase FdhD [Acidimicrobiales bacterium]